MSNDFLRNRFFMHYLCSMKNSNRFLSAENWLLGYLFPLLYCLTIAKAIDDFCNTLVYKIIRKFKFENFIANALLLPLLTSSLQTSNQVNSVGQAGGP